MEEVGGFVGGDAGGEDGLLFIEEAAEDANKRFDRFGLAEDDFGKAATALAVEIEGDIAEFGRGCSRECRHKICLRQPAGEEVGGEFFHIVSVHSAIVLRPCRSGYGGVKCQ